MGRTTASYPYLPRPTLYAILSDGVVSLAKYTHLSIAHAPARFSWLLRKMTEMADSSTTI